MVTVNQFKEAGFKFVSHDVINYKSGKFWDELNVLSKEQMQDLYMYVDDLVVESLAWRKNTGVQPVGDDCWVDVLFASGARYTGLASGYNWIDNFIVKWKPSLKHLEKQMNDNQEIKTALEMSERDIESYADDCDVERELKESDEVVWENGDKAYVENSDHDEIIFIGLATNKAVAVCECITNERKVILDKFWVSDLLKEKPETPEQKAARERDEEIKSLMKKWGHVDCETNKGNIVYTVIEQMLDEGYRK